ncbi:MAG TPA: glycoside hydrolase family 15 protein [Stellaceae bacterium]|nr:glycoside hydrolase family 15 protein [Stellaceae bacterium]
MSTLDLAVIGNCNYGALIDRRGRVVWCCLPQFDRDPTFCALLGGDGAAGGMFEIELVDLVRAEQFYWRNSAVLETRLFDRAGGSIAIVDLAPRFKQYGRAFRPIMLIRRVRPLAGSPRVRVRVRPRYDFGAGVPEVTRGSNHLRFVMPDRTFRLTTDAPVSCVLEEVPFVLAGPVEFVFGADETIANALSDTAREFAERTDAYWRDWCRSLSLPFEWQDAVIRAAITLKLMSFEDTGAVIAALTTSIPEAADSGRNWDYRYCWLRDAYFVVNALNRLSATRTLEGYLDYIVNVVSTAADGYLRPVYGLLHESDLAEREIATLPGYRAMGPVRVGNGACAQVQNDSYGSVILACAQSYFDRRLDRPGDEALFWRLEPLGEQAVRRWDQPDAGIWEYRGRAAIHTHSAALCWAACDRLALIAGALGLDERKRQWRQRADQMREAILARAWNERRDSLAAVLDGDGVDASLLLLPGLGIVAAQDPRFLATMARIERELRRGPYLYRYADADDLGPPATAFIVCSFWYVDALAACGRREEARELFETLLARRNHVGLLGEDLDVASGELWGNFPQTYSMVGLIQAAMRLSRSWEGAF